MRNFETEPKSVVTCADFNAQHQDLISTYNAENAEQILETGPFMLLNNDFHTKQSHQGDCRNMLDLYFTDKSNFNFVTNILFPKTLVVTTTPTSQTRI